MAKKSACLATERTLRGLKAYKVLGDDMTLTGMLDAAWDLDDLDGRGSLQHPEWQALYMQFQGGHTLGTVPYRWESQVKDYKEAQLLEVTFEVVQVLIFSGDVLHDASLSGADKACIAKRAAGIEGDLLMESLGRQGKVALVKESEEEWELLVPHCLLPRLRFQEQVLVRWRRHSQMPVTASWCNMRSPGGEERWRARTDDDSELACLPDLVVAGGLLLPGDGSGCNGCGGGHRSGSSTSSSGEPAGYGAEPQSTKVSGLWLLAPFLLQDEHDQLVAAIDEGVWSSNRAQTRRLQMFGVHHDEQYRVRAKAPVTPLPAFAGPLVERISALVYQHFPDHAHYMCKLGVPRVTEVFINEYDAGSSLQFHTDHTLTYEDMIVGVSLCSPCTLRFQHISSSSGEEHAVFLPGNSAYFMTGESRSDFKHGMHEGDCCGSRRVSLTFRVVRESAIT